MTLTSVDPDPTPTSTPWQEYLAAARSLSAVRREADAAAAAGATARQVARSELARVSALLGRQRTQLVASAARARVAVPPLAPYPAEQVAADASVAAGPAAVPEALRACHRLIATADAQLRYPRDTPPLWLLIGLPATAVVAVLICGLLVIVAVVA